MAAEAIKERTYSEDEIKARLARELPHWFFEGGWIRRKYRTHGWKGTLMVINTVGHLAEAAWHHPDITASYAWVEVRLQNHAAKGITDKDFELAKKIEDVVHWQPAKAGGALEGTPRKISASPTSNTTSKTGNDDMAEAWIRGNPVTLEAAAIEAARLLRASRMPVIAGLGTDVAGARAAIALARQVRGAVDHMHAAALLRDLDVMRESGMMTTTPNEARLRADLLLLVGPELVRAWPELRSRLLEPPKDKQRRIVWLCGGREAETAGVPVERIGGDAAELPALLASLRAQCAGRPAGKTTLPAATISALADALAKVKFGVAVWSAAKLDPLTIEMLCGLVKDLNATTRFSGLPLAPADNAAAVQQVTGWLTGFPPRTGFGRGYAEHDPWLFDATRLVESGEADCAVWISALSATAPAWRRDVPMIVLAHDEGLRGKAQVGFAVGRPGIDHDSVAHLAATGTLAAVTAAQATGAISVADALGQIAAHLPAGAPC